MKLKKVKNKMKMQLIKSQNSC